VNYPSIRIEGAILSPDIIDRLEDLPGQKPADFGFESGIKVKDEIARSWADAQDYWRIFQRKLESLKADTAATTETRNLWMVPLLGLLKYDLEYQKSGAELNGKTYAISHRVANHAQTPVHIVGYRDPAGLDRKPVNATLRMSAHAVIQEYLNLSEQLYGIVTNGRVIRLLRDSSRLIKQSYVEFDLDRIFTDGLFADFAVLFRLLHATRLAVTVETASESHIERLHQDSLDSGTRIREGLSKAVEDAILTFANGFLAHPENSRLRERLSSAQTSADDYYKSLLRLIYRLLFLMVIEERGLVFPPESSQRQRDTYDRYYSVHRLRKLSEKRYLADKRQSDLWLALLSTFRLFQANGPGTKLGLKPLAGDLFSPDAIGELEAVNLANDAILSCLRSLSLYQNPENKQLIRVNYAALNVEELGSVYEGLLKYKPVVHNSAAAPEFSLRPGDDDTQSHYTPDDLVQPLIKHSLDYLITERLKGPNPEAALLDLRVADIACGSGHILLAAARRIATELAVVRTGEEQPSPTAYRTALRDVIRNCIYGVDLNPLAVELCKVALWLEAHNPGEPLNFLDHHIKCGNAIVGFVRREEVDVGVPDEAFAKLPEDNTDIGKAIRARNKRERADIKQGTLAFTRERQNEITAVLDKWKTITAMPEHTPAEIDAKKQAFDTFTSSGSAWALKQIASIPISQFYLPRTKENESLIITNAEFRDYWSGNLVPRSDGTATAFEIARRKRFFHWFIEFPEIVQRGGFDCVLGNPPYLGGQALSGTYGHDFCSYVRHAYAPTGLSDLIVFFLRRIFTLIRPGGFTAFITTNSIKDGDIRKDGLEQILAQGGQINMAVRGVKWPGRANLVVSLVAIHKGTWSGKRLLDGSDVSTISPFFEDSTDANVALQLTESTNKVFQGTIPLGDGFLCSPEVARRLLKEDPRNDEVLLPVANGEDFNSEPIQTPTRFIINFGKRSEEKAREYSEPFRIVEEYVRPARQSQKNDMAKRIWWRYYRYNEACYTALQSLTRCFVAAATTKYLNFSAAPTNYIFLNTLYIFTTDRWDLYAVAQSTLHEIWARKYSGSLETRLRYSPTDCFENFAFPNGLWQITNPVIAGIGERYHEHRRGLMLSMWLGLTDIYNLFHSRELEADLKKHFASRAKRDLQGLSIPIEHRARSIAYSFEDALISILELRRLHIELDTSVRDAYGWSNLNLQHDFYEVETLPENDRVRYTISPTARRELLARLLKENQTRAAAEGATHVRSASVLGTKLKRRSNASDNDEAPLLDL
jgi:hypothetical protein